MTSVPLNLEKTHWSVPCAAMNFALSAGLSACARAPETISALTAAEIMRVLNIVASHRVCSVKEKEAFLAREQLASTGRVPCIWNSVCAGEAGFAQCKAVRCDTERTRGTPRLCAGQSRLLQTPERCAYG